MLTLLHPQPPSDDVICEHSFPPDVLTNYGEVHYCVLGRGQLIVDSAPAMGSTHSWRLQSAQHKGNLRLGKAWMYIKEWVNRPGASWHSVCSTKHPLISSKGRKLLISLKVICIDHFVHFLVGLSHCLLRREVLHKLHGVITILANNWPNYILPILRNF